jgi:hypothetical protein
MTYPMLLLLRERILMQAKHEKSSEHQLHRYITLPLSFCTRCTPTTGMGEEKRDGVRAILTISVHKALAQKGLADSHTSAKLSTSGAHKFLTYMSAYSCRQRRLAKPRRCMRALA